jgi:hypothetical protein
VQWVPPVGLAGVTEPSSAPIVSQHTTHGLRLATLYYLSSMAAKPPEMHGPIEASILNRIFPGDGHQRQVLDREQVSPR